MPEFQTLLKMSAERHHGHICPRQVLGVRMGLFAAELLNLDLPQSDKRLFTFVETDGCLIDGISVATGCGCGHRTMRIMDYGKTAATFVDTLSNRAVRVLPSPQSRSRASQYAPEAPDRWHAQLAAYQIMPTDELLLVQNASLSISLMAIISRHGLRVVCEACGEEIINGRQVPRSGHILCQACAGNAYYSLQERDAAGIGLLQMAPATRDLTVAALD